MKKIILLIIISAFTNTINSQDLLNYRSFQTPVKDQGFRGTCTAFGIAAALEILPGVPADISEQYLYGALKHSQPNTAYSEGDFLYNYVNSLKEYGFIHESALPYNPNTINWESTDSEFTRLIQGSQIGAVSLGLLKYYAKYSIDNVTQYSYFNATQASDPTVIINQIKAGNKAIAVNYNYLYLPTWSKGICTADNPITPDEAFQIKFGDNYYAFTQAKQMYNGDLIEDLKTGKVKRYILDPPTPERQTYGAHIVTIVGYNKNGFIFKNSWGKDWADKGYGYISFDAHRLMCKEAITFHNIKFVKPKYQKEYEATTKFYLKTALIGASFKPYFNVSIFTKDIFSDPMITHVTYKVYDSKNNLLVKKQKLQPLLGAYDNAFSVNLFENEPIPIQILVKNEALNIEVDVHVTNKNQLRTFRFYNVLFETNEYQSL
jgi:hypothetical protein